MPLCEIHAEKPLKKAYFLPRKKWENINVWLHAVKFGNNLAVPALKNNSNISDTFITTLRQFMLSKIRQKWVMFYENYGKIRRSHAINSVNFCEIPSLNFCKHLKAKNSVIRIICHFSRNQDKELVRAAGGFDLGASATKT